MTLTVLISISVEPSKYLLVLWYSLSHWFQSSDSVVQECIFRRGASISHDATEHFRPTPSGHEFIGMSSARDAVTFIRCAQGGEWCFDLIVTVFNLENRITAKWTHLADFFLEYLKYQIFDISWG